MRKKDLLRYLELAKTAATQAGIFLCSHQSASQVIDKNMAHDLKLRADKDSETLLIRLLQNGADFPILSEECGAIGGLTDGLRWIVDPLDGTINYSRKVPLSCVSVGLRDGARSVLGVIYDFNRKELFSGIVGQGAWLNGNKISVSRVPRKRDAILATGFPGKTDLSGKSIESFARNVRVYKKPRLIGSAALSMAYVAAGRFDAYDEKDIMLWDIAAGAAIVEAAGGKVKIKQAGHEYSYHVQACNGIFRM
ncbi:MAG: inositol monophosphatase [Candidatus Omnitrophica bacterium]|nr:inositol monophosphatase [Candidatus Omnitrophota bacterium]